MRVMFVDATAMKEEEEEVAIALPLLLTIAAMELRNVARHHHLSTAYGA